MANVSEFFFFIENQKLTVHFQLKQNRKPREPLSNLNFKRELGLVIGFGAMKIWMEVEDVS